MKQTPTLRCKGRSCKLLKHGTQVRVVLGHPKDIKGKRLYGKFRKSDMRWERTTWKITKIVLESGQSTLYKVAIRSLALELAYPCSLSKLFKTCEKDLKILSISII